MAAGDHLWGHQAGKGPRPSTLHVLPDQSPLLSAPPGRRWGLAGTEGWGGPHPGHGVCPVELWRGPAPVRLCQGGPWGPGQGAGRDANHRGFRDEGAFWKGRLGAGGPRRPGGSACCPQPWALRARCLTARDAQSPRGLPEQEGDKAFPVGPEASFHGSLARASRVLCSPPGQSPASKAGATLLYRKSTRFYFILSTGRKGSGGQ